MTHRRTCSHSIMDGNPFNSAHTGKRPILGCRVQDSQHMKNLGFQHLVAAKKKAGSNETTLVISCIVA